MKKFLGPALLALAFWADSAQGGILPAAGTATSGCELEHFDLALTLCDGVREAVHMREAWKSSPENTNPQWAELRFTNQVAIKAAAIHWKVEQGVAWSSRHYKLQRWESDANDPKKGEYKDIMEIKDNPVAPFSLHAFPEVKTDRLRVWQPPAGGPAGNGNLMWIAEIEAYDHAKAASEFGTASDRAQQRMIEEGARARTIGVFKRTRHQPRTKAAVSILPRTGMQRLQLETLDARELKRCKVVVLAGPRFVPNRDALMDYIYNGGAALFIHSACGRSGGSPLPDIWEYAGMGRSDLVVKDGKHPVAAGVSNRFAHGYFEHAMLKPGRNGKVVVADAEGRAVVVAGEYGAGRVVAIGSFPGLSSGENGRGMKISGTACEAALYRNSIEWLAGCAPAGGDWKESPGAAKLRKQESEKKRQFTDVTAACGLSYRWYSKAVAMADLHETGRLDLFATLCGPPFQAEVDHNLFYRNDGNWKFTELSKEAGIRHPNGIGCVLGDINGDGHLDLVVCYMPEMGNKGRNGVFLGDGKGGFKDITDASGLGNSGHSAQCLMSDFDNDGDLDLYLVGNGVENTLWRNRGDGTFDNATAGSGLEEMGSKGEKGYGSNLAAVMADFDGDGYQDLACLFRGTLRIFRNKAGKGFESVDEYMGPGKPAVAGGGLGMAIGDVDADGDLDMYAVGGNVMLRNEGKMRFSDVTAKSGLDKLEPNIGVYSPMFVDWNNDGKLDLYLAAGSFDSLAFQGGGGFSFSEVTGTIGLDCYAIHGCGFGDLDGDGDLDFYGTTWAQYDFALRRNNQDDGNYLKIRVKGRKSNTSGIGARVWVYDAGGQGANRRLRGYSEVLGGGVSMYTCPVLEQHFGVPGSGKYDVEVLFPVSGKRVKLSGEAAARTLTVEEPEDHGNDQGAGDKTK